MEVRRRQARSGVSAASKPSRARQAHRSSTRSKAPKPLLGAAAFTVILEAPGLSLTSDLEEAGLLYGIESTLKVPVPETILDAVASPHIQVWYDVAKMDKEGEDYGETIRRLGKERICEFHAKDIEVLYGQGNIDFGKMRDAMSDIGWHDAWVHIEGTQLPNGVEEDVRYDEEYLREVFGR